MKVKNSKMNIKNLERELKEESGYLEAMRKVQEFIERKSVLPQAESIKINSYGEYPWKSYQELVSNRWSEL